MAQQQRLHSAVQRLLVACERSNLLSPAQAACAPSANACSGIAASGSLPSCVLAGRQSTHAFATASGNSSSSGGDGGSSGSSRAPVYKTAAAAAAALAASRSGSTKTSRLGSTIPVGAQAAAAAGSKDPLPVMSGSIAGSLSNTGFWAARQQAFNAIPKVPKLLGFGGAIPFLLLHPAFITYLDFPEYAHYIATAQVAYGALIVSFLGAVHWGIALTSTLTGAKSHTIQRERYVWSVFPALAAWPALMMEPGPGSFCIALLLGICYMSDRAHARQGSLPAWYMTLRGYLTTIAGLSMLSTAAWFLAKDFEKMRKRMEEDDRRRAADLAARLAPPPPPPEAQPALAGAAGSGAAAGAQGGQAAGKKKGWLW